MSRPSQPLGFWHWVTRGFVLRTVFNAIAALEKTTGRQSVLPSDEDSTPSPRRILQPPL